MEPMPSQGKKSISIKHLAVLVPFAVFLGFGLSFFFTDPDIGDNYNSIVSGFPYWIRDVGIMADLRTRRTVIGIALQILRVCILCLWALGCSGLGKRLLGRLGAAFENSAQREIFGFGFGFAAIGLLFLGLGLLGFLYGWIMIAMLAAILILVRREAVETFDVFRRGLKFVKSRGAVERAAAYYFLLIIPVMFLIVSVPVWDGDGLMYHIAVPKLWLHAHRIYLTPYIMHSNFPFIIESNYGAAMLVMDSLLAKGLNLILFIFTAIGMLAFGRRFGSLRAGILAAVIWLSMPLIQHYTIIAFNDIGLSFFAFLTLWAMVEWAVNRRGEWIALFGACAGIMMATKLIALFGIVIIAAFFVILLAGSGRGLDRSHRRWLLVGVGLGVLFCGPWYFKSLVYTGNPVWPFLYSIFGGKYWNIDADRIHYFLYVSTPYLPQTIPQFLAIPWTLTMEGNKLSIVSVAETIGPVFFMFLPLAWFSGSRRKDKSIGDDGVMVAGTILLWLLGILFIVLYFSIHAHGMDLESGFGLKSTIGFLLWSAMLWSAFDAGSIQWKKSTPGNEFINIFPPYRLVISIARRIQKRPYISIPALTFILFFCVWFIEFMYFRYLMQMIFCLVLLLGFIVAEIRMDQLRKIATAMIFLFAAYVLATQFFSAPNFMTSFLDQETQTEFYADKYPGFVGSFSELCGFGDRMREDDKVRVLLAFEIRGALVNCPYYWSTPDHQGILDYHRIKDKETLLSRLERLGITHIFLNISFAREPSLQVRRLFQVYTTYYQIMEDLRHEAIAGKSRRLKLVYPPVDEKGRLKIQPGTGVEAELYEFNPGEPGPNGEMTK